MFQKIKIVFFFLFTLFFFSTCSHNPNTRSKIQSDAPVLRVAMDLGMPGYFHFNGQHLGYTYDLLEAYAQTYGMTLEIVSENTPQAYYEQLASDKLDMVATLKSYSMDERYTILPLYETSYVVLATHKKARSLEQGDDIRAMLDRQNILISNGFTATGSYNRMLDSLPDSHFTTSGRNTFELLERLINGSYDFLICERSEAQLGTSLIRNIGTVYEFGEAVPVCMALNTSHLREERRFTAWLYDFRHSEAAEELASLYFEQGMVQRIISGGVKNRAAGSISVYDDLFKTVAKEENLDWRLVSAIAYSESKYNAYLVSPRGARGLMQVMPATARAFEVAVDELMEPEANVRVAVQLIRRIEKSLKFSPETSTDDRTSMMLACYNGGIGHVTDARRLAAKHGANPDSWTDVAQYLRLKAQPEYAGDEVVKCGVFNGAGETLKFVNHVMGNYYAYCEKKHR